MGTGHSAAAEAILHALREREPGLEAQIVNSFQYASRRVGKIVEDGYLQMLRAFPTLYGLLYESRTRSASISSVRKWINHIFAGTFRNLLERWRPHLIICTHAFPFGVVSAMRDRFKTRIPCLGVVTDFVVHPFWIYDNMDMYAVATADLARQLNAHGIGDAAVRVTGIPIDPRFGRPQERDGLRDRLDVNSGLPVVLVMGGGLGMGPVEKILRALKSIQRPMHMVVLTGKNQRLRARLEEEIARLDALPARVKVFGYIDNVYEYMAAADLLVTKPGGLTSAEALACGLPMLIVRPLPGQEMRNSKYLQTKRVAVRVSNENSLPRIIEGMLDDADALQRMQQVSRCLARPDSAFQTASVALDLLAQTDT